MRIEEDWSLYTVQPEELQADGDMIYKANPHFKPQSKLPHQRWQKSGETWTAVASTVPLAMPSAPANLSKAVLPSWKIWALSTAIM